MRGWCLHRLWIGGARSRWAISGGQLTPSWKWSRVGQSHHHARTCWSLQLRHSVAAGDRVFRTGRGYWELHVDSPPSGHDDTLRDDSADQVEDGERVDVDRNRPGGRNVGDGQPMML